MATDYKTLQPLEYYKTFLNRKSRPDGRNLLEFRPTTLNAGSVGTADGSAIVKCGNTTVVCGIKAELGPPEKDEPTKGFIIANVTLPPLCSSQIKSGPPGETAQASTQFIAELVNNNIIIDLKKLCIAESKWVWVLNADLICLNLDGGLLDACSIAIVAALRNLRLPVVTYDEESEKLKLNSDQKLALEDVKQPVTSTFAIFENGPVISDPTYEEEQLASGTMSITMDGSDVVHMYKPGGSSLDEKKINQLIKQSELKAKEVTRLISEACLSTQVER